MTDNEHDVQLLRAAAKAAGIHLHHWFEGHGVFMCSSVEGGDPDYGWNPLKDDGDALRLAVKLRLHVDIFSASGVEGIASPGFVECRREGDDDPLRVEYVKDGNYLRATRRAIVRAAAVIGENDER